MTGKGLRVELSAVSRRYGLAPGQDITALSDATLSIEEGSVVGITGPSGSGKSTLLHLVGGMDQADAGVIKVGELDITGLKDNELADYRRTIGFVFQRFHLLPALSVLDNVAAPLLPYRVAFDKLARARELLAAVGLGDRMSTLPSRLSGGEQQRVAIARALINEPGLLLADEPTGNLDSAIGREIIELLLALRFQRHMTIIVATHDPLVAGECDRIVRLEDGHVTEDIRLTDGSDQQILREMARWTKKGSPEPV
jgi:putative ABC transport system ATP-binding protein